MEKINGNVTITISELDDLRTKLTNATNELAELKKNVKKIIDVKINNISLVKLEDVIELLRNEELNKLRSKITTLTNDLQHKEDKYNELVKDNNKVISNLKEKQVLELNKLKDKIKELEGKEVEKSKDNELNKLKEELKTALISLDVSKIENSRLRNKSFIQRVFNK